MSTSLRPSAVERTSAPSTEFIRDMLPLVKRTAATFAHRLPASLSVDDLVSAGFVALVELQQRRSSLPLDELERLAAPRLRGAMLDELRESDPLSRRIRRRARKANDVAQRFESRLGRRPTDQELGDELGVSPRAASEAAALAQTTTISSADPERLARVADTRHPDPEASAQREQRLARVQSAAEMLSDRHREVVLLYFAADLTLREIGEHFGVTESRVSQLLGVAVKELRARCASVPPPAMLPDLEPRSGALVLATVARGSARLGLMAAVEQLR